MRGLYFIEFDGNMIISTGKIVDVIGDHLFQIQRQGQPGRAASPIETLPTEALVAFKLFGNPHHLKHWMSEACGFTGLPDPELPGEHPVSPPVKDPMKH